MTLDILKENEHVDLYSDNDATGEKWTITFIQVAQLHLFSIQNGLNLKWDLNALHGSNDKIVKLITMVGIQSSDWIRSGSSKLKSIIKDLILKDLQI